MLPKKATVAKLNVIWRLSTNIKFQNTKVWKKISAIAYGTFRWTYSRLEDLQMKRIVALIKGLSIYLWRMMDRWLFNITHWYSKCSRGTH